MRMSTFVRSACALLLAGTAFAVQLNELTFPIIGASNATKQWSLTLETGHKSDMSAWNRVNCSSPILGACTDRTPALMQKVGDLLRLNFTLATPRGADSSLKTYNQQLPTRIEGRLCYTLTSSIDRAWRKKNKPYPRLSVNCPRKFGSTPFVGDLSPVDKVSNSGSLTLDFDVQDEIPTSTWFAMIWVFCGESVCAFETTENLNHVETIVEMGVTPGMKAAAIILSVVGPVFFIVFYSADQIYYNKYGKPIRIF